VRRNFLNLLGQSDCNAQARLNLIKRTLRLLEAIIISYTLVTIIGVILSLNGQINLATVSTVLGILPVKTSLDHYIKQVDKFNNLLAE
jgi:hypothetical protein